MQKIAAGCIGIFLIFFVIVIITAIGSYNGLVSSSQAVDAEWAQVQTVYQRRADLIPQLVSTVTGAANYEKSTLTAVVEARASATQVKIDLNQAPTNQADLDKFQAAQANVSSSLSRLLAVSENYPDLKANGNFRDLQAQLEGTENRIAVERGNFNTAVQAYNTKVKGFPTVLIAGVMGFQPKAYFQSDQGAQNAPKINFDFSGSAAPAPGRRLITANPPMGDHSRRPETGRRKRSAFRHSCLVIRHFLGGALFFLLAQVLFAAEVIPPAPDHYFNDYANVVSSSDAQRFNAELEQFEKETSNQIVVAVFPKMQSDSSLEDYSQRLFQAWKIGQTKKNNGALLLVFVQDRTSRIQTGYGLEGALPDITCKRILDDEMAPHFKQNDFAGGFAAAINAMMAATKGEYKGTGQTNAEGGHGSDSSGLGIVGIVAGIFIVFNIFMVRRYGWFFLLNEAGWIFSSIGSGSSSGGGGGGGGGGFSGGGGSSGGGGASGSW